jgi:hypothetical protein
LAYAEYNTDATHHNPHGRRTAPKILTKHNREVQGSFSKQFYAVRSRIECFIGHLTEPRRIAS